MKTYFHSTLPQNKHSCIILLVQNLVGVRCTHIYIISGAVRWLVLCCAFIGNGVLFCLTIPLLYLSFFTVISGVGDSALRCRGFLPAHTGTKSVTNILPSKCYPYKKLSRKVTDFSFWTAAATQACFCATTTTLTDWQFPQAPPPQQE